MIEIDYKDRSVLNALQRLDRNTRCGAFHFGDLIAKWVTFQPAFI